MVQVDYKRVLKDWEPLLRNSVLHTNTMSMLIRKLQSEYKHEMVYPAKQDIFRAFKVCSLDDVRVVIVGQDPYPNERATGLAFGNEDGDATLKSRLSPSLQKIKECVEKTVYDGFDIDFDPSLVNWSKQGVLLLNSSLTVRKGESGSHALYWRTFVRGVLRELSNEKSGIVFLLLGAAAKDFKKDINYAANYLFEYTHPAHAHYNKTSWDCPYFKKINEIIEHQNGKEYIIKW